MFSGAENIWIWFSSHVFVQQEQKEDIYENCLELENHRRSQIQVQPYKYRVQWYEPHIVKEDSTFYSNRFKQLSYM